MMTLPYPAFAELNPQELAHAQFIQDRHRDTFSADEFLLMLRYDLWEERRKEEAKAEEARMKRIEDNLPALKEEMLKWRNASLPKALHSRFFTALSLYDGEDSHKGLVRVSDLAFIHVRFHKEPNGWSKVDAFYSSISCTYFSYGVDGCDPHLTNDELYSLGISGSIGARTLKDAIITAECLRMKREDELMKEADAVGETLNQKMARSLEAQILTPGLHFKKVDGNGPVGNSGSVGAVGVNGSDGYVDLGGNDVEVSDQQTAIVGFVSQYEMRLVQAFRQFVLLTRQEENHKPIKDADIPF